MFIQNKYTIWYYSIITNANKRTCTIDHVEKHHIIPKSMGGTNDENNLVALTLREHFICHILLTKMVDKCNKFKMNRALWYMCNLNRYNCNSRRYELARREFINTPIPIETRSKMSKSKKGKNIGSENPNFGNYWSQVQKDYMSNLTKGKRTGKDNPMYGRKRLDTSQRNSLPKRWVTDGIVDKLILRELTDDYLDHGFKIGRSKLDHEKLSHNMKLLRAKWKQQLDN